ncbi:STAS domain-containing protein [Lignipirellula cremea]|uniref:Anti-sigma factor antagonist n=1 Tax=Lignipirellula cremea TaxID=2528010 RepID=A0A518DU55_9BACT|nr:STAS domain-containing protein [Lignipirellula cremea]QDU95364.1 Anti-sigma F factor antagonist [Lignipirellula cremea]
MKLTQQENIDHVVRLDVSGSLDFHQLSPLDEPLSDVLGHDAYKKTVIMNMRAVDTLDSSGVGWLLTCQKQFRSSGGSLVLHSLSPTARNVLRVLNLQRVLRLADDEKQAIVLTEAGESSG